MRPKEKGWEELVLVGPIYGPLKLFVYAHCPISPSLDPGFTLWPDPPNLNSLAFLLVLAWIQASLLFPSVLGLMAHLFIYKT